MKRRRVYDRLYLFLILVIWVSGQGLSGCASVPKTSQVQEAQPEEIRDIEVRDLTGETEIRVETGKPMIYTAYQLSDPTRIVLDLTEGEVGHFIEEISVDSGVVQWIRPSQQESPRAARLEIGLREFTDFQVESADETLLVRIRKPLVSDMAESAEAAEEQMEAVQPPMEVDQKAEVVSLPSKKEFDEPEPLAVAQAQMEMEGVEETEGMEEDAGEASMAPPAPESSPETPMEMEEEGPDISMQEEKPAVLAPAETITAVQVQSQEQGVRVTVEADGVLEPNVFTLEGPRLVMDFPGTVHRVKPNVIRVNDALLKRIRLGQHLSPQKVRLVMDLSRNVLYEIEQHENRLMIELVPAAEEGPPQVALAAPLPPPPASGPPQVASLPQKTAEAPRQPSPASAPAAAPSAPPAEVPARKFTGRPISLDFQDAEVAHVLRLLADVSGLNMVLGEDVGGKITLKLDNVPWDQAMEIILKTKGLGQVREGNVVRIDTNANISRQQEEEAKAKESLMKAEDLASRIIWISYSKANDLAKTLEKSLSSRGNITVDEGTNTLIVKDISQKLDEVSKLVKILDRPTPQVLIEARIVVASNNFSRDLGVQWGFSGANLDGNHRVAFSAGPVGPFGGSVPAPANVVAPLPTPESTFAVNLPASGQAGSIGNLGFTYGKFSGRPVLLDLRISAGEVTGEARIISSPKILTLDNKEAVIQQGESIPFETVSDQGTQTQFVDATLNLTVTPHITPDGSVIMKINATKNAIGTFRSARTGAPSIDKREAETEVLVRDGETTVIGGILEAENRDTMEAVPWLHRLPGIGWLFKRKSTATDNNELLIFITPTIVKS